MERYLKDLELLASDSNYRQLLDTSYDGKNILHDKHSYVNFSSNDYLGVGADAGLQQEFWTTLDPSGFLMSSSSSRLLTGNHSAFVELEKALASAYQKEEALVFNSGFDANLSILPALTQKGDLVLADKLVHASLIDAMKISPASFVRYRHNDYDHLEKLLQQNYEKHNKIFIVSESVFSMDGDLADLQRLVELKKQYNAFLYLDEAHSFGVFGPNGLGLAEDLGLLEEVDFLVGTFGKVLASLGAFVICNSIFKKYLVNKARSLIYSTALPPINVLWTKFIFDRFDQFAERRRHLQSMADRLRSCIASAGLTTMGSCHIVPLVLGSNENAVRYSAQLKTKGIWAMPVRTPTVPEGTARIRFSLSSALTDGDVDFLCKTILDQ